MSEADFSPSDREHWLIRWRAYVSRAASQTSAADSAICPFGFELTADARYADRLASRCFVYLAIDDDASRVQCTGEFASSLFACNHPDLDAFRVVVRDGSVEVRESCGSRTLYIHSGSDATLDGYCRYIAASSLLIVDGTLYERRRFASSPSARRYVYQLTVMAAYLTDGLVSLEHAALETLLDLIRMSPERDRLTGQSRRQRATSDEWELLQDLVLPIHEQTARYLRASGSQKVRVVDLQDDGVYQVAVNAKRLADAATRVRERYLGYPELLGAPADEVS
jgi:hypothetical protein